MPENSILYWDDVLKVRVDNSAIARNNFLSACLSDIPRLPFNVVDEYLRTVRVIHKVDSKFTLKK